MEDVEHTWICYRCIGDHFLRGDVRSQGKRTKCSYCDRIGKSFRLGEMAERIDDVIKSHFSLSATQPQWEDLAFPSEFGWMRDGYPVNDLIQDIACVAKSIATDVQEYLSDHSNFDPKEDEEDPYGDEACYEENGPDDSKLREAWDFVRRQVRFRSRFFNSHAQQALSAIFHNINTLHTWEGAPAIKQVSPADQDRYLYRARVAFSDRELKDILGDPVKGIGPPPSRKASAGRMNASGISVFYGAMDEMTCIAEVRAPVGSYVVMGRFEIIHPLRLLDFDVLTQVYVETSHFDPEFSSRHDLAAFLKSLVREISQPVMPHEEEFEYLPTQALSEYLASCVEPRLDGIVFESSQTAGEGRNVVLFNHARCVEPYVLPAGTKVDFCMGCGTEDFTDDSITIFEIVAPETPKMPQPSILDGLPLVDIASFEALSCEDGDDDLDYLKPTLRLDVELIRVVKILAVDYKSEALFVSRHRMTKQEIEHP